MLRAEQLALIQEANQQLLAIRQQEMNYYVTTFSSFGTQAALIAGFTLGALTGLDVEGFNISEVWRMIFWLSTSISMAASIHCVLTTTFANIYGPNLALRGPSGSMVRAVKGMIAEKTGIFVSFIISLIAFQLMTLATTWVVMKTYASSVCTCVLMIGAIYWYKYCLRIYNRFKFVEPDIEWRNSDDGRSEKDVSKDEYSGNNPLQSNMMPSASMSDSGIETSPGAAQASYSADGKKTPSLFSRITGSKKTLGPSDSFQESPAGAGAAQAAVNKVWMEGYLSKMGATKSIMSSAEWTRRYFVLRGTDIYYYKNREDFEADPTKSIKNRPITIVGYQVHTLSQEGQPPYEFELRPENRDDDRRNWRFKCDTLDEMTQWTDAFSTALRMR